MNLWPLNDDQVFRLTVFIVVLMAVVMPLLIYALWQDAKRREQQSKKQEFERLRIRRKRA
ncbi:MAG: hypothetical protein ACK4UT_07405 [Moraxellaceae bacterium]